MGRIAERNANASTGFTLVEILIVVCVITVLIGLTASATASARQKSYIAAATTEVEQIAAAFKSYRLANPNGNWPHDTGGDWESVTDDNDGLKNLIGKGDAAVVFLDLPDDRLENGEFKDPWGHAYQFRTYSPGASGSGEAGDGEAGRIVMKEVVETVVSFPNQFGRYYEFGEDVPYVDDGLAK